MIPFLDAPMMDLDDIYPRPRYRRCALVLALWLRIARLPKIGPADICRISA